MDNYDSSTQIIQEKKFNWFRFLDIYNLSPAGLSVIFWLIGSMTLKLNPLYVPPDDSLSNFPRVDKSTVSNTMMIVFNFLATLFFIILFYILRYFYPKYINQVSPFTAAYCCIMAVCFTGFFTNLFKYYVGRPRPDMYDVCGYNATYEICSQSKRNGEFVSFPSGHSSNAMSGCLYLALFVQKAIKIRKLWWTLICCLFLFLAVFVGCSRIVDHRHHPDDVIAGLFVGLIVTFLVWKRSYKEIFPKKNYEDIIIPMLTKKQ